MPDIDPITEFYLLAAEAKDAKSLLEAAKSTFDSFEEYADYILSVAKAKGFAISGELAELEEHSAAAREKAQRERAIKRPRKTLQL